MTAARSCRACGAELAGEVRWCGRCYTPTRELTPRAPVWGPGEFADAPIVTSGAVPHWSRWEKSPTTFGPVGRIAVTAGTSLWLLTAVLQNPITLVFALPLFAIVVRNVWRPGWVVPPSFAAAVPRPPQEPVSTWLWDRSEVVSTVASAAATATGVAILLYVDDPIARFVVIVSGVVVGAAWLARKVAGGR